MSLIDYLASSNKTHLIFDFDETIIKLLLPWENALDEIKDELISLDRSIYENFAKEKISLSKLENRYTLKFGDKALRLLTKSIKQFERDKLQGYLRNERLIAEIKKLSRYEMSIWSSNTKLTITKVLEELHILQKFPIIVSREDVTLLKPYSEGFQKIHDKNVSKTSYIFIGDSKHDKAAADEVGIEFYLEEYFNVPGKYW